jgi:hypothetical protein
MINIMNAPCLGHDASSPSTIEHCQFGGRRWRIAFDTGDFHPVLANLFDFDLSHIGLDVAIEVYVSLELVS